MHNKYRHDMIYVHRYELKTRKKFLSIKHKCFYFSLRNPETNFIDPIIFRLLLNRSIKVYENSVTSKSVFYNKYFFQTFLISSR